MLKKNKDYVEFTLQYTSVDWARSKDCPEVCLKGNSDFSFPGVPIMDVVCNEFDHKVVVVSKRVFDRLQADDQHYRELAKQREEDYKTLSKLIGFSSTEEIQDYLTNEAECDTLQEAVSKLKDQVKYTCDEWYSANSHNNSWKAAAECNSPKELIEKLNLLRDDISGRSTVIESYKRDIEEWQKATGYLRPEDISIESMISKSMANEITAANENLWRENEKCEKRIEALLSEIREWRETTGCPSPSSAKTLIESGASWMSAYHSSCEVIKTWKKLTGCPTPIAAKTLIESAMAYEHGFHEAQEENRKLTEEVDSWKHVTGFSSPEDYEGGWQKIRRLCETIYKSNDNGEREPEWKDATGCVTPDQAKSRIEGLENAVRLTDRTMIKELENNIDEWQAATGCDAPEKAQCKITDLYNRIDKMKEAASIASNWTDKIVEA